jgi:hypothetical protein
MGTWTSWKSFPSPGELKGIQVTVGPGVYQLRNKSTGELVLFGIGGNLRTRMASLMPRPFGSGTRNNTAKRDYVLAHHHEIEYRVYEASTRVEAALVERVLKQGADHLFNT